jgi:hypothetical protein
LADRSQAQGGVPAHRPTLNNAVGRGLRAPPVRGLPRRPVLIAGSAVILAALLGAGAIIAALTGFRSSPTNSSATGANGAKNSSVSSGARGAGTPAPGTVRGFPTQIGNVQLIAVQYAASDVLARPGSDAMKAMLTRLSVDPAGVRLTAAVDRQKRLSVGVWTIPGANASALLEAWQAVATSSAGWKADEIVGQSVLVAHLASGGTAYVAASDGRFIYIVTSDPLLAAAALTALR